MHRAAAFTACMTMTRACAFAQQPQFEPLPVLVLKAVGKSLADDMFGIIDAKRRTRERFETPDENYVAVPEVNGIVTIKPESLD